MVAIEGAGQYNRNDQTPPAAVLWTDKEREWEPMLPRLRARLPTLLTFGPYNMDERSGPAYWLRSVLAGALPEPALPAEVAPTLYLPGVSRQELRAVEDCPRETQPLAELQYRGVLWTQRNGRDWTVAAFLQSEDGGLGIPIAGDSTTREALGRALTLVADEPLEQLRAEAPLRATFFDTLLHPDEARSLLRWLNDPAGMQRGAEPAEWAAFRDLCRTRYGFDPASDGPLTAARLLGQRQGPWQATWNRLAEAPGSYLGVATQLRQARSGQPNLFDRADVWPQDNEAAEAALGASLLALADRPEREARATILALEAEHGVRREWLWAKLGWAPQAMALGRLAALAAVTERSLAGATAAEIATVYAEWGWQADAAVLAALAAVEAPPDLAAVRAAIRAVYAPWLAAAARALQATIGVEPAPVAPVLAEAGDCLLFSDGLRFDVAQLLREQLDGRGLTTALDWRFAALPTVTATAKPALSPVAGRLGPDGGFDVATLDTGTRATATVLRRLLADAGYQVLADEAYGDPSGRAWTELGDIDAYCHEHGWKVSHQVAAEVRALTARIVALLDAGWQRVVVLTDHGWLLLPGGLPKVELPEQLTEQHKGRCARLKPFARTDQPTVPWFWDSGVTVAVASGIACFEAGREAEHGGVSPQECIVPVLSVRRPVAATAARIDSVRWRGLVCQVRIAGGAGLRVDLRTRAGDAATSITTVAKTVGDDGAASLPVPDDDREGVAAFVVLLAADGSIAAQMLTTVGG